MSASGFQYGGLAAFLAGRRVFLAAAIAVMGAAAAAVFSSARGAGATGARGTQAEILTAADGETAGKKQGEEKESVPLDRIVLADGKEAEGQVLDITEKVVLLSAASVRIAFPRGEVKEIRRAAPAQILAFCARKSEEYAKAGTAKEWRSLAKFAIDRMLLPEHRAALREVIRLEPQDEAAHLALGHALHGGQWLEEEEVEAKLKEGFVVSDGKLLKPTQTTVRERAPKKAYKFLDRSKLAESERKKLEKARTDSIKAAEKFQAAKLLEYEGIEWTDRHKIRTRNFEVHCNSTRKVAESYGAMIELIRAKLSEMFPSRIHRNLRAPVFIYRNQEDFMGNDDSARWMGRGLGGYYRSDTQAITTFHGTFGFTGTTFGTLCHEGTHYYQGLVLKDFDNIPGWLVEGLAVYFGDGSLFDPKTGKIEVGKIPRDRLAHIQEKMILKKHTSIDKLVTLKKPISGSNYADAWALIYFLVKSGDKGTKLLTAYWSIGLERLLTKSDFVELAKKFFGSVEELERQYTDYISKLEMPSAGSVVGDYFVSDPFQFDYKAPSDEWKFFEDKEDKKLLVGLALEGSSAEIRVYYENNLLNQKGPEYFEGYLRVANAQYENVEHVKAKIANLEGYKLTYVDNGSLPVNLSVELETGGKVVVKDTNKGKPSKPARDVIKYMLIQIDGIVSIECSAVKGEGSRFTDVFDKANESFSLRQTRRW